MPDGPTTEYADLAYERYDNVAVITFDRPDRLNAFRANTHLEMRAALAEADGDDRVRVLVITGNGRAFSSGADLQELGELLDDPSVAETAGIERVEEVQDLTRRILDLRKPVIAAINGVAVGLGAELALACDLRIASTDASIGFVEAKRGLFQTNGVTYLLPRLVGYGRAMELLMTADLVSALDAERMGLIGRVVPHDELLPRAIELAEQIARNAPISVRLIKDVLRRTYDLDLAAMMQLESESMATCLGSDDLHVGIASFLSKQRPRFRGE